MPKTILLVEDSDDDAFFIVRALKSFGLIAPLAHVADGQKAIEYLSGKGAYADRIRFPIPNLVLLDIKLPFISGFEVLRWLREEAALPRVPVVMFTSSCQGRDVEKAYALGANAYLVKPNHGEHYTELAGLIKRFWLDVNVPPPLHCESAVPLPSPAQKKI
jgi:CheY-like chemotaxis protein